MDGLLQKSAKRSKEIPECAWQDASFSHLFSEVFWFEIGQFLLWVLWEASQLPYSKGWVNIYKESV